MRDKRFPMYKITYPLIGIGLVIFFIYQCRDYKESRREKLEGVWLVPIPPENKLALFTFSTEYVGKGSTEVAYFRLINPMTGKIQYRNSISYHMGGSASPKCITESSLWMQHGDEWICLDFPSLKKRWNKKSFFKYIKKHKPEIGEPYSAQFAGDYFSITNTAGKTTLVNIGELEKKPSKVIYYFENFNQLGYITKYPTPETRFKNTEGITIEIEDGTGDKKQYPWIQMNIYQKLQADTGYAKYYAVFTPDSHAYYFDGKYSKVLRMLVNDSAELKWQIIFNKREWLQADFIRPYKEYNDSPRNRYIITSGNIAFIQYNTSLDKKANHIQLSGIDLHQQTVIWETDLDPSGIVQGYNPEQNYLADQTLVTTWMDGSYRAILTGIEINTGKVKWTIKK